MIEFFTVQITFMDDTSETFTVTYAEVYNDQLHTRYKGGEMADDVHMGSYPLCNIKKWRRLRDK